MPFSVKIEGHHPPPRVLIAMSQCRAVPLCGYGRWLPIQAAIGTRAFGQHHSSSGGLLFVPGFDSKGVSLVADILRAIYLL